MFGAKLSVADTLITKDAVSVAKEMAKYVKDQMLDGLDVDYEDIAGMKDKVRRDGCVKWVIGDYPRLSRTLGQCGRC